MLVHAAGQLGTGSDVAPLIRAADLQHAVVAAVQLGEVVALQQRVGEFGVGNALAIAIDTLLHRFLFDHGIHREVLADVAQEFQRAHAGEPVVVVGHDGRVGAFEIEEGRDLAANLVDPAGDDFGRVELALGSLETGVANHAGGTAHQRDRLVASLLEAFQDQHRHQMAQMQRIRRGVEAAIQRDRSLREHFIERVCIGGLGNQATRMQILQKGGLVHHDTLQIKRPAPCAPREHKPRILARKPARSTARHQRGFVGAGLGLRCSGASG